MKNIFILYMPPGNYEAMIHYEDTIKNKVNQDRILKYIDVKLKDKLQAIFGKKPIAVWGSRDGEGNRPRFEKMQPGDDLLIVEGETIRLLGKIAEKTVNEDLSKELWKNLKEKNEESWKLIYFIANPVEIDLPFSQFKQIFSYKPDWSLRGFTSVSSEKLEEFYNRYDDLYSILVRIKNGEIVEQKIEEKKLENSYVNAVDESVAESASDISDHIIMQWKLLQLGIKSGSDVWLPKNDQTKIKNTYEYDNFKSEFVAGIDAPGKYVEQIDVIWKEEFQINAAFEIENSTSIYSGLLRFSDLKIIAPNSNYPLFIVAQQSKKGRVISQVNRPTFKKIDFDKKVRFLSYETVNEIDQFFTGSSTGLTTEMLIEKSESISS